MSVLNKKIKNLKAELKRAEDNQSLYKSFSLPVQSELAKAEVLKRNIERLKIEINSLGEKQ